MELRKRKRSEHDSRTDTEQDVDIGDFVDMGDHASDAASSDISESDSASDWASGDDESDSASDSGWDSGNDGQLDDKPPVMTDTEGVRPLEEAMENDEGKDGNQGFVFADSLMGGDLSELETKAQAALSVSTLVWLFDRGMFPYQLSRSQTRQALRLAVNEADDEHFKPRLQEISLYRWLLFGKPPDPALLPIPIAEELQDNPYKVLQLVAKQQTTLKVLRSLQSIGFRLNRQPNESDEDYGRRMVADVSLHRWRNSVRNMYNQGELSDSLCSSVARSITGWKWRGVAFAAASLWWIGAA
ncbi:hypothetical protein HK104_007028 [Borealophlyctis nickersoniae]|nr:hypothetical protein HK104_007028 [Borealophlyctis nickersoniae]